MLSLVIGCESKYGCEREGCQKCCAHDEYDHDMCLDCGYERDPGEAIDRAMDLMDMER